MVSTWTSPVATPPRRVALFGDTTATATATTRSTSAAPPSLPFSSSWSSASASVSSASKKEDLPSWKAKRDRWLGSPRPKLKPLPTSSAGADTSAFSSTGSAFPSAGAFGTNFGTKPNHTIPALSAATTTTTTATTATATATATATSTFGSLSLSSSRGRNMPKSNKQPTTTTRTNPFGNINLVGSTIPIAMVPPATKIPAQTSSSLSTAPFGASSKQPTPTPIAASSSASSIAASASSSSSIAASSSSIAASASSSAAAVTKNPFGRINLVAPTPSSSSKQPPLVTNAALNPKAVTKEAPKHSFGSLNLVAAAPATSTTTSTTTITSTSTTAAEPPTKASVTASSASSFAYPPMPSKAAKNPFGTTLSVQSSAATKVASLGALGSALGSAPAPVAQPKGANIGTEDFRIRLIKFYQTHNASKVGTVDATLKKYKGKEDELFRKLETKYAAPQPTAPQFPSPAGTGPRCYLEFSIGNEQPARRVVVKLYRDKAPLAAENFRCLCTGEITTHRAAGKPLRYLGSKVHRIVPGFCLQAGDFTTGNGRGGASIYPLNSEHGDSWGKFRDEPTGFLNHSKKGLLSMANSGKNTNSSQFFFTLKPVPYLNGKHVVFGEIEEGMDALEELGKVTTDSKTSRPIDDVVISSCGEIDASGNDCPSLGMEDETESSCSGLVPAPFGVAIGGAPVFGRSSSAFGSNGGKGSSIFGKTPAFSLGHSSSATSAYGSTSTHASAAVRSPSVLGSSSSSSNYTTSANISNGRVGAGLSTSGSTIAAPVLFGSSSTLTNNKAVPVHSAPVFGSPSTLGIGGGTPSVPGFSGSSNSKSTSGFWTLTTAGSPGGAEPVFGKLSSFGVDGTRSSNTSRKSAGGGFGALSASTSPPAVFGRPSAPKPSAFGSRSGNSETATDTPSPFSFSPSRNNFSFGD